MATNPQSVIVGGSEPQHEDGEANAAIEPGQLLEHDGDIDLYTTHSVAAIAAEPRFAETKEWGGDLESATDPYDDAYAAGDYIRTKVAKPGTRVNAQIASSQSIAVGDYLMSNGDGNLQEATLTGTSPDDDGAVIAIAREAVSTGTSETAHIEVQVI